MCSYSLLCLLLLQSLLFGVNACEFRCGDGTCIGSSEICNGEKDCMDGSDETQSVCEHRSCKDTLGLEEVSEEADIFRCDYGGCISNNLTCNGMCNCADGSDETMKVCKSTTCARGSFRCNYGACISLQAVCDGVDHCHDGSDEKPEICLSKTSIRLVVCPRRTKKYCDNRRECYYKQAECDGKKDCTDGSDEKENCQRPATRSPTGSTSPPIVLPERPKMDHCPPPNCRCPTLEHSHFCLPCREIADFNATCLSLNQNAVCSVALVKGVSFDLLSCGVQPSITTATFARWGQPCHQNGMVPVMTTVLVDCWGVSSTLMRCHNDGYWRKFGALVSEHDRFDSFDYLMEKQPMKNLCQPYYMNSQVCGRRPRYKSTGTGLDLGHFHSRKENRWPMVMGLKKRERYECSATLITPLFLLTAAHCVVVSQESRNETMHPNDLRVQLSNRMEQDQRVQTIILHPDYEQRRNPLNDLALIKLKQPVRFNAKLYPACVDLDGDGFLTTYRAMTFSRANGEKMHKYTEIRQQIDPTCHSRIDRCRGRLQIEDTQFCGVDLDTNRHLEGGSSGGPFMQNLWTEASEEWAVSGVVSFNIEKQSCDVPHTIFTNIKAYKTWITNIVHDEL